MEAADHGWDLVGHLLLRRAGFPFGLLLDLACPETALALERAVAAEAEALAKRRALSTAFADEVRRARESSDRGSLRALSRWRKRVGRGVGKELPEGSWSPRLRDAHREWVASDAAAIGMRRAAEESFADEHLAARTALFETAAREDVRLAVFLSSPAVLDAVESELASPPADTADSRRRAIERRLYAFVQRLAAKNETTSFFGPITYATVAPTSDGRSLELGPETPNGVTRSEAFPAFWAVAAIGRAAARDERLRSAIPPARVPLATVRGNVGTLPGRRSVDLSDVECGVWAAVDGRRRAAEIAGVCGSTLDAVEGALARLQRKGLVTRTLEPLSTTMYPLRDLLSRLPEEEGARPWRDLLQRFDRTLDLFAAAPLRTRRALLRDAEEAFTAAVGGEPRRGGGEVYADRLVLYEDCLGDAHPAVISPETARSVVDALAPAFGLARAYGEARHQAIRAFSGKVLAGLGGPVPYLDFASELSRRLASGEMEPHLEGPRAFERMLADRVERAAGGGRVARLDTTDLPDVASAAGAARFASPDVMLGRRPDGSTMVVLSEVHPYVFAWGSQAHFASDPAALQAAFDACLETWGGPGRMAVLMGRRRHKGLITEAFPGKFVEVSGHSSDDPDKSVPVAELVVDEGDDGPVLRDAEGPLTLYIGEEDSPHLRAFAPPLVELPRVRLGPFTPRIEIGDLVVQRARWELDSASHAGILAEDARPFEVFAEVVELAGALGTPRFVFAHSDAEPKPMLLDLWASFAHEHLRRLLGLGDVALVEMLPGPSELWLERSTGGHTSELRLACYAEAGSRGGTAPLAARARGRT